MSTNAFCGSWGRGIAMGVTVALFSGCGMDAGEDSGAEAVREMIEPALQTMTVDELLEHTRVLASDEYEGRAPATRGGEMTVDYLVERFRSMGLAPGHPNGGYTQSVDLVGIRNDVTGSLRIGGREIGLDYPDSFVGVSYRDASAVDVAGSELVFVGYGVEAPEYGWDDFGGQDMTGKTLVMLVNDPPVPDPGDPSRLDPSMFNGEAMTYYGRWTYKYEIGAEKGADAVIVVHETEPAGYPWEVVSGSWGGEQFDIRSDSVAQPLKIESWVTAPKAREMFEAAGHDFDELKARARSADFEPVPLNGTADFHADLEHREVQSENVIAKLEGAESPDEYIIYTAHWDHLGRDSTLEGDQIYNGALDNASGTAGLLELAEAFAAVEPAPDRSILFLAVTAEEKGLLGAKYYAQSPLYPLERTLANVNIDGVNQWGRTEDIVVVGMGNTTLEDVLAEAASAAGRRVEPDPEPEKGFYYRSDHFEFAKHGVPALYTDVGTAYIDQPEGYGERKREEYTTEDYHKPSDEIKEDWDLSGAVEDLRLLFQVGYTVSETAAYPEWKEGTEFKARREEMLRGAGAGR